jgi:ankyrin repeat protein
MSSFPYSPAATIQQAINAQGDAALHTATISLASCLKGLSPEDVEKVVSGIARVRPLAELTDQDGWTLMHYLGYGAVFNVIVQADALVKHGLDINAVSHCGETPLHCAAGMASGEEEIEHLVKLGANLHATDEKGRTPLFSASPECARRLVSLGAELEHRDAQGYTALQECALRDVYQDWEEDICEKIRVLLQLGADPTPPPNVQFHGQRGELLRAALHERALSGHALAPSVQRPRL